MSENIIKVRNLSKKFKNHHAVKNISFDLKRGEIKGILGANGAGKTTTITMLLGLLTPTSGSIKILSTDISKDRYKILNKILPRSTQATLMLILEAFFKNDYIIFNASNPQLFHS